MPPSSLTLSDVVFSEQANHNFSKILGDLKKANLSISNRLSSILQDAAFVEHVAEVLGLPLVANERCGSWYIDPERKAASAYFKSTDGHVGQWRLSTRRLNLHLLELIGTRDGFVSPIYIFPPRATAGSPRSFADFLSGASSSTRRGVVNVSTPPSPPLLCSPSGAGLFAHPHEALPC